jgi:hypothetical protein
LTRSAENTNNFFDKIFLCDGFFVDVTQSRTTAPNVGPKVTTWRGVIWPRDSLLPTGQGASHMGETESQEGERERRAGA